MPDRWQLGRRGALEASILAHGATLQELLVPGPDGRAENVVLGYSTAAEYETRPDGYLGATIGRYANRIAGGRFTLDGRTYELPRNDRGNCLHGGPRGFHTRRWSCVEADDASVTLAYVSADGEMGFPGRLSVAVTYTLGADELRLDFRATTDAPTVVNLTNHTCWNLGGADAGPARARLQTLQVEASRYTPLDETGIPRGEVAPVDGTVVDFRSSRPVGPADLDHNVVLDPEGGLRRAASLAEPTGGRSLEVWTTQPCLQLWTGGALTPPHEPGSCVALETQHAPDSPNQPRFPSTTLRPGETFASTTVFRFGTTP